MRRRRNDISVTATKISSSSQAGDRVRARSLLFDLWGDYIQHLGGEVWTGTLAIYLSKFGVTEQALRQALSRMRREGWLEVRRVASRSCYSLSARGQRRMEEAYRRVYAPEVTVWDGEWRVLAYSIPESMRSKRDELRRELSWTGFAHLAPGTWISPNPLEEAVAELVARYGIEGYVSTFLSRHLGPGTAQDLVQRCWDLSAIQASYDRFIGQWAPRIAVNLREKGLSDDQCFVEKTLFIHDFRKFLFVDPHLPRELLPVHWRGHDARQLFQQYHAWLEPAARRFQDSVFEPTR